MIYVTDTHPLVFHLTGKPRKLGRRAASIFRDVDRGRAAIVIPITVLEEIMRLVEKDVVQLPRPFVPWVRELSLSTNYRIQPYTVDVLLEAAALPQIKDPCDRLVVATARLFDYPLITRDQAIKDFNLIETIWN